MCKHKYNVDTVRTLWWIYQEETEYLLVDCHCHEINNGILRA
jgi:hypothetical protein